MPGPECCMNPPEIISGSDSRKVIQIGSLNAYVSGKLDSKLAVILVSDVWGYGAPKLRNIADKVAYAGYYVVVPDFFHGDPLTPEVPLKDWLPNHQPEKAVKFAKRVIQALKEKGITKVGAAGFCWGAKVVVELGKQAAIEVAALLHPSFVTLDDVKCIKVPTSIQGAELDKKYPPELIKQFEAALEANKIDHFVKIYPGVKHGWTVRYEDDDKVAVKYALEAHRDLVEWINKCLKTNSTI